mmetsp:Transcript_22195/g.39911  ORF Transcript_22195/g.39911 Transcript_22195/m.39911 type:complete len:409 (-) Transcript_22195:48-1274(-)
MAKKGIRRPQPLAPPPQSSTLRSRKRARQVTTKFHKYTQERDAAVARARAGGCHVVGDDIINEVGADNLDSNGNLSPSQIALMDEIKKWDGKISEIGGRGEYQRASQLNTHLFSTSKWVLGILGSWGWLDGLQISSDIHASSHSNGLEKDIKTDLSENHSRKKGKKEKIPRRDVLLLEVGAINTQLLDAAARTRMRKSHGPSSNDLQTEKNMSTCKSNGSLLTNQTERVYHLDVKAIDIRSTDPRIEEMNFFDLPLPDPNQAISRIAADNDPSTRQPYDVIVNSMVINCLTTPDQRGKMLSLCYLHLRPGGVCFITVPKLCLIQSKFMSRSYFEEILTKGVGFEILREVGRESPKVAFFVLRRPKEEDESCGGIRSWDDKFARMPVIHRGKKFRNTFAVTLNKEEVVG